MYILSEPRAHFVRFDFGRPAHCILGAKTKRENVYDYLPWIRWTVHKGKFSSRSLTGSIANESVL